jgi:heterotetrameric sarcosine oxidase delta subunit
MSFLVPCPICGKRPAGEFDFGGELRDIESPDIETDYARVFLEENRAGEQVERWFHAAGCRRWLTVRRDTRTNAIHGLV